MFGLKQDWSQELPARYFTLDNYDGGVARWCPGCGDHAVLSAVQKVCRDAQLPPEKTVAVSGIGCSSRFPHYMSTYGFHGLHGRALPVACGIKARRPDLHVWVASGDGDCFSIGAGHWLHAIRYNMDMTLMVFDNGVYGLTKAQTSPTSPAGFKTNTHPFGAPLPPHNPLTVTLAISNVSFVAQTIDWNVPHLYATLSAAFAHKGLSFVRILQRCPQYSDEVFAEFKKDPSKLLLLNHKNGIGVDSAVSKKFPSQHTHDPADWAGAMAVAAVTLPVPIGLLYCDASKPCYEQMSTEGLNKTTADKLQAINAALDHFMVGDGHEPSV